MIPNIRRRYTAYVIFQGAEHDRFWKIFTKRGWRHCFIILPAYYPYPSLTADVYSIIVNPTTYCVDINCVWERPRNVVDKLLDEGYTAAIAVPVDVGIKNGYIPRGVLTCVSLVKAILGIKGAWYVWTPEHLARYLARMGGEVITRKAKT